MAGTVRAIVGMPSRCVYRSPSMEERRRRIASHGLESLTVEVDFILDWVEYAAEAGFLIPGGGKPQKITKEIDFVLGSYKQRLCIFIDCMYYHLYTKFFLPFRYYKLYNSTFAIE